MSHVNQQLTDSGLSICNSTNMDIMSSNQTNSRNGQHLAAHIDMKICMITRIKIRKFSKFGQINPIGPKSRKTVMSKLKYQFK